MTTETIQRSIFKMNPEFWHQRMSAVNNNGVPQSPDQPTDNNTSPSVDENKYHFNEAYTFSPKFEKYQQPDIEMESKPPRCSPTEVAQNLSADGFGYKVQTRSPEMSPPTSLLQNLSPEQLRNLQSTLATMTQSAVDVRSLQATAVQNLSTHLQNIMSPNTLNPNELRNLQSLAISNLSSQVQTITNATLNHGDIRNLTTIAVQNLTSHIENLRNQQNTHLTPNEIRNLTTVAVSNLMNHIQNLNQMNQPATDLQRNLAAFQQLAGSNFSAMQNLGGLSGMSNNIAAVSAVLTAAAAQQAALSQQHQQQQQQQGQSQQTQPQPANAQNAQNNLPNAPVAAPNSAATESAPENGEPDASNGSNSASNGAAALSVAPLGSGPNSNADKLAIADSSIFMHKSAMQMHARDLQTKPHQCQQCLKSFSSNHQLVQHIRVHTGEKPYKCSYCDRRFKQLSHVQQHTRLHTGERPYRCHLPECGRAFIQLSNLQQHLRNHDAQVERAKNRPFHCNICGKGFATESSLRTHTSKEQREALMGLPLSSLEPRLQEMSQLGNVHNPSSHAAAASLLSNQNAVTCPLCHKLFLGAENLMEHMKHTHKDPNASGVPTKRRTANHPCPICGKHYVNEGSLRKHLACHPETAQLSSSLRMWPCSVCQAVFTHESGLLSHMEHMRMDPKHQFAAQYVLSRAAAERRERESLLAAAVAASNAGSFSLGGQSGNSMCPSPTPSDSSSIEHLSSTGSDTGGNVTNNNNNNNDSKVDLAHMSPNLDGVRPATPNALEYGDIPNRMAALNAIVQQTQNLQQQQQTDQQPVDHHHQQQQQQQQVLPGQDKFLDQITPSNLIMRNTPPVESNHNGAIVVKQEEQASSQQQQQQQPRQPDMTPAQVQQLAAMRANLENMRNIESLAGIRSGYLDGSMSGQQQNESVFRMQQQAAEVLLRTQAEALRLAVTQAAAAAASGAAAANSLNSGDRSGNSNDRTQSALMGMTNMPNMANISNMNMGNIHGQLSPDLTEALRLQEQRLEQALRLHGGDPRVLSFSLNAAAVANSPNSTTNTPNNT